jgi:hypothetical protein
MYGIRKISIFMRAKQKAEARSQQQPPTTANNNNSNL